MPHASHYLLVFHGSRDPRPLAAATALAELFAQRLQQRSRAHTLVTSAQQPALVAPPDLEQPLALPLVSVASLELAPQPLHQQIQQLGNRLLALPAKHASPPSLHILPLFLLPGVHVMEDIPAEVAIAQQALGNQVTLQTSPYLGTQPRLRRLLTEQMAPWPLEAWILLAHGSRRPQANQPIADLADHLGAIPAYWSVPPQLEARLQALATAGLRKVGILPYFLFSGGITDAIAQTTATLALQFPQLDLHLAPPLNASPELADLLLDLAASP